MVIYVNDEKRTVEENLLLSNLFPEIGINSTIKGVAVAINERIVMQKKWKSTILSENDKILIISATKGG
ncbi:sulfur carrier protein ThiS [Plebeiibacterium sediminum]|uniref:Sulfur carrier protein ThiS n=1 Tax=Plebeiibacterium sediminum TaxID=2992112 RepID=A0AAE3M2F9_9BACT|nr:sulfur carrier protein ThiS [Plebeiobacterium sediminum]MCW3785529.1 sulfur carrier protein ThiS [Plebeiobacterium sediminum]